MSRLLALSLVTPVLVAVSGSAPALADGTEAPSVCASCVVVAPTATPRPVELAHRWGVSARAVSLGLDDGTTQADYAGGGFGVSYRLNPRWELAASFDALDAPEGPDLHTVMLTARFHLRPLHRWDWYALAGLGSVHEVPLEGDTAEAPAPRGAVMVGAGLARRFPRWSLAAELHGIGVGPRDGGDSMATSTARETMPASPMATEDKLSGGELTLAASFYF